MQRMKWSGWIVGMAVLASGVLLASDPGTKAGTHVGKQLPEIIDTGGTWFNSEKGATFARMRGGPVLVCYTVLW